MKETKETKESPAAVAVPAAVAAPTVGEDGVMHVIIGGQKVAINTHKSSMAAPTATAAEKSPVKEKKKRVKKVETPPPEPEVESSSDSDDPALQEQIADLLGGFDAPTATAAPPSPRIHDDIADLLGGFDAADDAGNIRSCVAVVLRFSRSLCVVYVVTV